MSPQVIGARRTLDLATLQAAGVRLVGRVTGADGKRVQFAPDLPATTAAADEALRRLLDTIDGYIDANGLGSEVLAPECPAPVALPAEVTELDLRAAGIRVVVWATGHRRAYPWLRLPVFDDHGEIRQRLGRTPVPGLYVLGQRFQHHRSSSFICGVGRDAGYIADHITGRHTAALSH